VRGQWQGIFFCGKEINFKILDMDHTKICYFFAMLQASPPPPMFAVSKLNLVMFHSQRFVFEACQDLTLVILMVAAAISLTLGMTTEVLYYIIYYWTASSFYPSPGSFVLKTLVLY
jgi:hypothetical protein